MTPEPDPRERLRYFVLWAGRHKVAMGARLRGEFVRQEFDRDTRLGDAIDILHSRIIRVASGLEDPGEGGDDDPPSSPQQQEIL